MHKPIIPLVIVLILLTGCNPTPPKPSPTISIADNTPEEPTEDAMPLQTIIPALSSIPQGVEWKGSIAAANLLEENGTPAIEFNQEGFNVIWLDGYNFTDGTIEFDAMGKSEPQGNGFIGVAFRLVDQFTYDAVYFRPFNFRAIDPDRKSHAVQYISHPDWPWYRLRTENPGQYEQPIESAPDGDSWFHAKIVIAGKQITVFVNNATEPSLQVTTLTDQTDGFVGLWCYGYGVISNLKITPAG